ncbi:hypothetical protein BDV18DRAFT_157286 [Aspergillus unguis]
MDFLTVFFVLPTASSYSTRINVLFFYMTWTTLVMSHTAIRVELFGTLLARFVFYILPSLVFFLFDIGAPGTAVSFKERGESALPTGTKRYKKPIKELKIAGWSLGNLFLGIFVQMAIEFFLIKTPGLKPAVKMSLSVPMPWDMAKWLFFGFLLREILIYTIHRFILHSRNSALSLIVNWHRNWYHKLSAPFPLTAHYDHPAVYLLGNFVPMYLPVLLFRFHMITFLVYTVLISIEETFIFSGYYTMPSFLLSTAARRTESHAVNSGKYFGRWAVIDLVAGTGGSNDDGVPGGTKRK